MAEIPTSPSLPLDLVGSEMATLLQDHHLRPIITSTTVHISPFVIAVRVSFCLIITSFCPFTILRPLGQGFSAVPSSAMAIRR